MTKIKDLNKYINSFKAYGGHAGSKEGIIIDNEKWLVKYPKSTKSMDVDSLTYTTAPISEYIGSCIYKIIGIDAQETILGYRNEKVVVACKDFIGSNDILLDFNAIKNDYSNKEELYFKKRSSSKFDKNNNIEDIMYMTNNNKYFKKVPSLKERFWDMFIIDSFINNNDRNETNWGLIYNEIEECFKVAPVYDNGASFYINMSEEKVNDILKDSVKLEQILYHSAICSFTIDNKLINPLKYIESMLNEECNRAVLRLFNSIDMEKIKEIIYDIPSTYNDLLVLSDNKKELYIKVLEYRYNILKEVYNDLRSN